MLDKHLNKALEKRQSESSLRSLKPQSDMIDFCSNDYLGFSKKRRDVNAATGSTGSRLISGHHDIHEKAEREIALFHNAEASLIFNSGYDANLSFFSTVPKKGDTVVYDQLCHASIRDGLKLGNARSFSFKHNDIEDLKAKLNQAQGVVYVAVESVYSMDGDLAPLAEIDEVCTEHWALLVVDEAHATGVFGLKGEGLCGEKGIEPYAQIHTFGKALGCHGAVIFGTKTLKDYLINFARPFIYTTALPPHSVEVIRQAYADLENCEERIKLRENIEFFKRNFASSQLIESNSPIQCVVVGGNARCREMATKLQEQGLDVRAILSPTVAEGAERIRICLHSYNSQEEIAQLCGQLKKLI